MKKSKNQDFYSSHKQHYFYLYPDHISYSRALFEELYDKVGMNPKCDKVYDACCGVGYDLSIFKDKGFQVKGSDISETMVSICKRTLNLSKDSEDIICSDVLNLRNSQKGIFDIVLFRGNALGHFDENNQQRVIDNLFAITRKKGIVIIDFRNGEKYFDKMSRYEKRGFGFDRKNKVLYLSKYYLKKRHSHREKYIVHSMVMFLSLMPIKIKYIHKSIKANFVIEKSIMDKLNLYGEVIYTKRGGKGLQEIVTYVISKN